MYATSYEHGSIDRALVREGTMRNEEHDYGEKRHILWLCEGSLKASPSFFCEIGSTAE